MQVDICWLSVKNFECLTLCFEQHVEVIGNIHSPDCPVGQWREPLLSVPSDGGRIRYCVTQCLVIPKLYLERLARCTTHNIVLYLQTTAAARLRHTGRFFYIADLYWVRQLRLTP